ncbi:MAG: hypothetical protein ACR2I5_00805, partial [Candidatus Limnocylindria bacterium]
MNDNREALGIDVEDGCDRCAGDCLGIRDIEHHRVHAPSVRDFNNPVIPQCDQPGMIYLTPSTTHGSLKAAGRFRQWLDAVLGG